MALILICRTLLFWTMQQVLFVCAYTLSLRDGNSMHIRPVRSYVGWASTSRALPSSTSTAGLALQPPPPPTHPYDAPRLELHSTIDSSAPVPL